MIGKANKIELKIEQQASSLLIKISCLQVLWEPWKGIPPF